MELRGSGKEMRSHKAQLVGLCRSLSGLGGKALVRWEPLKDFEPRNDIHLHLLIDLF